MLWYPYLINDGCIPLTKSIQKLHFVFVQYSVLCTVQYIYIIGPRKENGDFVVVVVVVVFIYLNVFNFYPTFITVSVCVANQKKKKRVF